MTDPDFPFRADFDAEAERVSRGPLDRRETVLALVVAAVGAVLVGAAGLVAVLELAVSSDDPAPIVVTGVGPFAAWVAGATLALIRLVRRRSRAWLPMLVAVGVVVLLGVVGAIWWLAATGLL